MDRTQTTTVALSVLGAASMIPVSLLQLGLVDHLPDPPIRGFDSDRVNLSETASLFGIPDGPISLASMIANVVVAPRLSPERRPLTLAFAVKATVEAVVAGWYFVQMPRRERAWCGYCLIGGAATVAIAALALSRLRTPRGVRRTVAG